MKVGFVGLGNMGTALANLVAGNGHDVLGWEHSPEVVQEVNERHTNTRYLPDIELRKSLKATRDIREAMAFGSVLFVALPTAFIRKTLQPHTHDVPSGAIIVNLAKGMEKETYRTSFQVLAELFPDASRIMLSGPSIAREFATCMPTMVVLAGKQKPDLLTISKLLDSDCFRTRFSDDETGVELGGILKNIYAIGLGMYDGLGIESINLRSVFLTLALEEMTRFGVKVGGRQETFYYIAGLGDMLATSLSRDSHNRELGEHLAKGKSIQEIDKEMGVLPEGYTTLQAVLYIAEKNHVAMPLAKALWDAIGGRLKIEKFVYSFIRDFIE
jgi:glycerol-3-phosphate dehydrogenase (NAD(P)+)